MTRTGIYRAEIWLSEINIDQKDVLRGRRPVIVISSWRNNIKSSTVNVVPLTTSLKTKEKNKLEYEFEKGKISTVICSQIATLNKESLIKKLGEVPKEVMEEIDNILRKQLQLEQFNINRVEKMVESIKHLNDFMVNNNLDENEDITRSIYLQRQELQGYCKEYGKDYKCYLKVE